MRAHNLTASQISTQVPREIARTHRASREQSLSDRVNHSAVECRNRVGDVTLWPYSRQFPQFSRDVLAKALHADGIGYVFLGKEVGGRPSEHEFYCDGIADYEQ